MIFACFCKGTRLNSSDSRQFYPNEQVERDEIRVPTSHKMVLSKLAIIQYKNIIKLPGIPQTPATFKNTMNTELIISQISRL